MTSEQTALIKKAQDSLRGARLLADQSLHDFAASRAYYAMFYVAQAFLLEDDLAFSSHAGVIAAFGKHFAHEGRVPTEFHRYLIDAQDARTVGDYSITDSVAARQALQHIERAEEFIRLAEEHLGSG